MGSPSCIAKRSSTGTSISTMSLSKTERLPYPISTAGWKVSDHLTKRYAGMTCLVPPELRGVDDKLLPWQCIPLLRYVWLWSAGGAIGHRPQPSQDQRLVG